MSSKKTGVLIFIAEALLVGGNIIGMSYINYCYTNLGHVSPASMSAAMTVVSILGFIMALFSGAIVQKTRAKMGKFRAWVLIGGIGIIVGDMLVVTTFIGNPAITVVVISVGYFLFNACLDFVCMSKYNLYGRMAQGNSELIDTYNSRSYAGGNLGFMIYPMLLLPLVGAIGGSNENTGYFGTQVVFGIMAVIGVVILLKISKPFDHDEAGAEEEMPDIGLREMLGSLAGNGPAIAVVVGEICKTIGYALFNFLLVYQCSNVFGSMEYMTWALVAISIVGVVGAMIAPAVISKIGGRKRTAIIVGMIAGVLYLLAGFLGKTPVLFLVLACVAVFVQNIHDTIEAVLYIDAGEYWYHKTGNDTRAFIMGMQNIATKIAYAIASPILGVVLVSVHFSEEALLTGQNAAGLTLATGVLPAAGMFILALVLAVFHKVSDKEITVCIEANAKKDAELYGAQ